MGYCVHRENQNGILDFHLLTKSNETMQMNLSWGNCSILLLTDVYICTYHLYTLLIASILFYFCQNLFISPWSHERSCFLVHLYPEDWIFIIQSQEEERSRKLQTPQLFFWCYPTEQCSQNLKYFQNLVNPTESCSTLWSQKQWWWLLSWNARDV